MLRSSHYRTPLRCAVHQFRYIEIWTKLQSSFEWNWIWNVELFHTRINLVFIFGPHAWILWDILEQQWTYKQPSHRNCGCHHSSIMADIQTFYFILNKIPPKSVQLSQCKCHTNKNPTESPPCKKINNQTIWINLLYFHCSFGNNSYNIERWNKHYCPCPAKWLLLLVSRPQQQEWEQARWKQEDGLENNSKFLTTFIYD